MPATPVSAVTPPTMPCPRCGKQHAAGPFQAQPDRKKANDDGMPYAPDDVQCDCGAVLRHTVPLFVTTSQGWEWRIR
jgi:hypothetical protein